MVHGRADDVITCDGERFGPGAIEECLTAHPDVALAAAIGVPDAARGEVVKAFVVVREGASSGSGLGGVLLALGRRDLPAHSAPRAIEFVTDLPRTTTGKVMRRELRRQEVDRQRGPARERRRPRPGRDPGWGPGARGNDRGPEGDGARGRDAYPEFQGERGPMRPIWQMSAVETAAETRSGRLSCAEVMEAHSERFEAVNPDLNAVTVDLRESARERADALDEAFRAGAAPGPLHGVPVTIKENVDQTGQATPNGVAGLANVIAPRRFPGRAQPRTGGRGGHRSDQYPGILVPRVHR